ncbi:molybdenum cofactor guanylyltransferase [Fodinibius sp.]|uniref:molybdenum cofactor guanylyltransferase n=1 Tax=Fodinibius sp. TaxID=1872440 RepID=UPI002ACD99C5|nr:molybdenum cofactor guanylyltransferase [Fodinibius sp.]MDZ7659376.1 molybdenum cofactor guanylyltransferase [Fodinibius sp.]
MKQADIKPITVIILAGGQSRRMGSDKGLVRLNDKPMVQHVIEKAQSISNQIMIITNQSGYQKFGVPTYSDLIQDKGPLGGIYTGLHYSQTENNLVLSCDIPLVPVSFLKSLVNYQAENQAYVPVYKDQEQPLCAVYKKEIAEQMKSSIEVENLSMRKFLTKINTAFIEISDYDTGNKNWFANLNTPEEVEEHQTDYDY